MTIKKGDHRIVITLPLLGIAIKIPLIGVISVLFDLTKEAKKMKTQKIIRKMTLPLDCHLGYKSILFYGVLCNLMEFFFFVRTRNKFCQPTYFSLFGLINIQKLGSPCKIKECDLWQFLFTTTEGKIWDDIRVFSFAKNFCSNSGIIKITNYGNQRTRRIIEEYGHKLANA